MRQFLFITSLIVLNTYCVSILLSEEECLSKENALSSITPVLLAEESLPSSTNNDFSNLVNEPESKTETSLFSASEKEPYDPSLAETCKPDIQPYQINVRHLEWEGIGYKEGYTTLQGFISHEWGNYIPFLDVRGHVFNNGKWAANTGLGLRYIFNPLKSMVGANIYYDYRNTKHQHYNQIGVGLEGFYDRWEMRANGYFPIGSTSHNYDKQLLGSTFKTFQGHYLLINEHYQSKQEFAMTGFNAELGAHPLKSTRNYDLYVAAGPYYFAGKNKHAWGGMIRAKATGWKYFSLEVGDSYDHLFHNRFHAEVAVSVPLGGKKLRSTKKGSNKALSNCFANNIMFHRASQPAERQEIIVIDKRTRHHTIDPIAIDPATGQPFYFVFVNNTNVDLGDGTFENPFSNLSPGDNPTANAQEASSPGNIIYVFSGDGTPAGMGNGISLKNSQRFLGSGVSHQFITTKGNVVVPSLTTNYPSVTTTDFPGIVILAPHSNEVSGFILSLPFSIPTIATLTDLTGNVSITRNILDGGTPTVIANFTDSPNAPTTVLIDNNQITGGHIEAQLSTTSLSSNLTLTNNACNNSFDGLIFAQTAPGAIGSVFISGNEIQGMPVSATEVAIGLDSNTNAVLSARILNNNIHDNGAPGISMHKNFAMANGAIQAEIASNILNNNAQGVQITTADAATSICTRLINNRATNNGGNDYVLTNTSGALKLEPPENNIGVFTLSGIIDFVPPCSCNVCP